MWCLNNSNDRTADARQLFCTADEPKNSFVWFLNSWICWSWRDPTKNQRIKLKTNPKIEKKKYKETKTHAFCCLNKYLNPRFTCAWLACWEFWSYFLAAQLRSVHIWAQHIIQNYQMFVLFCHSPWALYTLHPYQIKHGPNILSSIEFQSENESKKMPRSIYMTYVE